MLEMVLKEGFPVRIGQWTDNRRCKIAQLKILGAIIEPVRRKN